MNKEKFLAKGVARKYEKGEVLFNIESLHEHYEGINYHLTDILEGGFIRPNDVFGADIREIEFVVEEPVIVNLEAGVNDDGFPVWVNAEFTSGDEPADDLILPEITKEIEVVDEVILAETPEE